MIDKQKLRELIEQVAEIEDVSPRSTTDVRYPEVDDNEIIIDGEEVVLNKQFNPTLGFELLKLKPVERLCELGCGKIIPDQKIERRFYTTPARHWRTKCVACGLWELPDKTGFVDSRSCQNAHVVFFHQIRNRDK